MRKVVFGVIAIVGVFALNTLPFMSANSQDVRAKGNVEHLCPDGTGTYWVCEYGGSLPCNFQTIGCDGNDPQ